MSAHPIRIRCAVGLCLALLAGASPASDGRSKGEQLAALHTRLGEADRALAAGRLDEAHAAFAQALDLAARLGEPSLPRARATDGLADVARLQGRPDVAEPLYREAARSWVVLLGRRQPRVATTLHNLGVVCWQQDKPIEAERHLERALEIWIATLGPDSANARNTESALRRVRSRLDDPREPGAE